MNTADQFLFNTFLCLPHGHIAIGLAVAIDSTAIVYTKSSIVSPTKPCRVFSNSYSFPATSVGRAC